MKLQCGAAALCAFAVTCSTSYATISYQATGLGGPAEGGPTASVQFTFTQMSATAAALTVAIENTTAGRGRIVGFAFNVPTIQGATFTSIGGATLGGGPVALSQSGAMVIPEVSGTQHETGWFAKWETDGIKTPGQAGDFDFGVRNSLEGSDAFITSASGNGPSIMNKSPSQNSSVFTFSLAGTGFDVMTDAEWEDAFASELSSGQGNFAFALRFRNGGSDLAVSGGGTPGDGGGQVPLPGAALLAAVGLGCVGLARRRLR